MRKSARPPISRFRRWRRRLGRLVFVAILLAAVGGYYAYRNLPEVITGIVSRQAPHLSLSVGRAVLVSQNRLELHNVSLRLRSSGVEVLRLSRATVDFTVIGLRQRHLDAVTLDDPVVLVNDALLQEWPASVQRVNDDASQGPWTLGAWTIRGGEAEVDLAQYPNARFDFSSAPEAVPLTTTAGTRVQRLELNRIALTGRDANAPSRAQIRTLEARSTVEEIARGHLRELIVRDPSLQLTPEVMTLLRRKGSEPSATPAGAGFRVDRLVIEHGEMQLAGFGTNLPEAAFKFGLETTDVGAGENAEKLHHVQLWEIALWPAPARIRQFLTVDSAQVNVTLAGLLTRNELAGVIVTGGVFRAGREFRSLIAEAQSDELKPGAAPAVTASPPSERPWKIRRLDIHNGRVVIADLGVEIPEVQLDLNTKLNDVPLSSDIAFASNELQKVELADLSLHSPLDPFVTVVNLKTVFVSFSFAQLMRQEIDSLVLLNPIILISPDLFWYVDELKKRQADPTPADSSSPVASEEAGWRLNRFEAAFGQLVIANQGQAPIALPLSFATRADDIRFSNFNDLQLQLSLLVPTADYSFPAYQISFRRLGGEIKFGLPPEEEANNLVQTLRSDSVRWRQFLGTKVFWSVTYDEKGIYGSFGGAAYGGYLNGEFSFFLKPESPWQGWISGSKIDLTQLTDLLAPQNFSMTGPADFALTVKARSKDIEEVKGEFRTRQPGRLKIGKLDELLANIPAQWSNLKQSATRIGLETLRDFDYESGHGDIAFAGRTGKFTLRLQGPHGSRNFDVHIH